MSPVTKLSDLLTDSTPRTVSAGGFDDLEEPLVPSLSVGDKIEFKAEMELQTDVDGEYANVTPGEHGVIDSSSNNLDGFWVTIPSRGIVVEFFPEGFEEAGNWERVSKRAATTKRATADASTLEDELEDVGILAFVAEQEGDKVDLTIIDSAIPELKNVLQNLGWEVEEEHPYVADTDMLGFGETPSTTFLIRGGFQHVDSKQSEKKRASVAETNSTFHVPCSMHYGDDDFMGEWIDVYVTANDADDAARKVQLWVEGRAGNRGRWAGTRPDSYTAPRPGSRNSKITANTPTVTYTVQSDSISGPYRDQRVAQGMVGTVDREKAVVQDQVQRTAKKQKRAQDDLKDSVFQLADEFSQDVEDMGAKDYLLTALVSHIKQHLSSDTDTIKPLVQDWWEAKFGVRPASKRRGVNIGETYLVTDPDNPGQQDKVRVDNISEDMSGGAEDGPSGMFDVDVTFVDTSESQQWYLSSEELGTLFSTRAQKHADLLNTEFTDALKRVITETLQDAGESGDDENVKQTIDSIEKSDPQLWEDLTDDYGGSEDVEMAVTNIRDDYGSKITEHVQMVIDALTARRSVRQRVIAYGFTSSDVVDTIAKMTGHTEPFIIGEVWGQEYAYKEIDPYELTGENADFPAIYHLLNDKTSDFIEIISKWTGIAVEDHMNVFPQFEESDAASWKEWIDSKPSLSDDQVVTFFNGYDTIEFPDEDVSDQSGDQDEPSQQLGKRQWLEEAIRIYETKYPGSQEFFGMGEWMMPGGLYGYKIFKEELDEWYDDGLSPEEVARYFKDSDDQ